MRTRSNYGVIGQTQSLTINSTGGVYSADDQRVAKSGINWPGVIGWINYYTPGTYTFTVPSAVTTISGMAVGGGGAGDDGVNGDGGGGGGSGGSSGYFSNLTVTPGSTITIVVGNGGPATTLKSTNAPAGNSSSITYGTFYLTAYGGPGGICYSGGAAAAPPAPLFGNIPVGVTTGGYAGGSGGAAYNGGGAGGGAGGLAGVGGNGGGQVGGAGGAGTGGGGGGGSTATGGSGGAGSTNNGFTSGAGGAGTSDVTGGGGGGCVTYSNTYTTTSGAAGNGLTVLGSKGGDGGFPGGGGGGSFDNNTGLASAGGNGFVRLIWGSNGNGARIFPTNAGDV